MKQALWVILVLVLSSCGSSQTKVEVPPMAEDENRLGPGDIFDIRVFGEEELTGSYRIGKDGTIDFPLVGRVEVAGLEPPEVADRIRSSLREGGYLKQPQVSIFVKEYKSKRVSVMGAVARPGTFPVSAGLSVVEAVSLAGGFTALASRNSTVVSRRIKGELRRFKVPADDITNGRAHDFPVQAGDIVYVPERLF